LLAAGEAEVLGFFSARGARLFAAAAREAGWPLGGATALAIGGAAAAALDGLDVGRRVVAPTPDRAGMLAALAALDG
ncbi:MAG TPA: uroporphyrinogen-III synthase, partial [Amaricoccus sp.]|nr:uroporphyrinogen-III synthase [Amaricoccus sp.]